VSYYETPPAAPGGTVITPGPVTYTDFSNRSLWLPIGHPSVTQTLIGNGLHLAGNVLIAAGIPSRGMSGVVGLFRILPDPVLGEIDCTIVFDQYIRPTDLGNQFWLFGQGLFNEVRRMNGAEFAFAAYGGRDAALQDRFRSGNITPGTGTLVDFAFFATAIPAATTFTINIQVRMKNVGAFYIQALDWAECTMDGGGGPLGGAVANPNTYYWHPSSFMGFRPFCGCIFDTVSQLAQARVTSFTVTTGQVLSPF
jgi:hypothetical protein